MDIAAANSDDINWLKVRLEALRDFFAKEREGIAGNDDLVAKFHRAEHRLQRALDAVERVSTVVQSRAYKSEAGSVVAG